MWRLWRELMYRARHHGGRADLDRAGRHRHGAVGPARAPPACRYRLAAAPGPHPALHHRGRLAAPADRGAGRGRGAGPGGRLSWRQAQGRAPMWPRTWRASPPCARPWATTGTSWWTPTRAFGARGDPRARLRALDIAWLEEPIHADDVHAHRRLSASTTVPIAVGESLYSLSQFRTICRATPARWCRWTWAASAASRRG